VAPPRPFLGARLSGFATTIFAEMSQLATATGSINLGQGFPDTDGPRDIAQAAVDAIWAGHNQYPPGPGIPELRRAIAGHQQHYYGLALDPETEVLVTAGATEAIAASLLSLCEPGDEVVMFDPSYDSYRACVSMAGATASMVPLRTPSWRFEEADLRRAITARTRLILVNSPHNPTGKVFSRDELDLIARLCVEHDLLCVTDEVYEHLIFEGQHLPLATWPGMAERTLTISSAGKTFSFTGWKVGWACGPGPMVAAVRAAKQFLTYVNAGPFQYAVAQGLAAGDRYIDGVAAELAKQRDQLCAGLADLGLEVLVPAATYFATTDVSSIGVSDAVAFCRDLPVRCGVVAIPSSVFYDDPRAGATLVRWAFCKKPEVLAEALARLAAGLEAMAS
jgi:N-succinyldiaminopimelate aminotransferase